MISEEFDDVYFCREDGLGETRYTYLEGNNLPAAWGSAPRFCICELGFGTGLNIFAAWKLFEDTAQAHQRLDLISIEKYPLTPSQIREALSPWAAELGVYVETLLAQYPLRVRGFHRIELNPRVTLTLIFDDVLNALPQLDARVDAWFLDGFAPVKNPDMWQPVIFARMAQLSHAGTTLATFSAAGDVRRGLKAVGFAVTRRKGFGRKWYMSVGRYLDDVALPNAPRAKTVAVIGAGIAGLSVAWHLHRAGCDVTVYEAADTIAAGASGNMRAITNPKLTAQPSASTDYYTSAYAYARRVMQQLPDIDFMPYGALHLEVDADKARRFDGYIKNLGWHADHIRLLDAAAASDVAGIILPVPCLHYPDVVAVNPAKLCAVLARDVRVVTGHKVTDISALDADAVVIANAAGVTAFSKLPVTTVRGQVSMIAPNAVSMPLRANLSYGGYITPIMENGLHMCGATFQPWGTSPDVLEEDHARNLAMLAQGVPGFDDFNVQGGRTGFRAATPDRLPIVGGEGRIYYSVAHGSHGVISGLMAGAVLAASITGGPMPLPSAALMAVAPARFQG